MTNYPPITFKHAAVEPIKCLSEGWNLVKDKYWLFVGMCFIGMLIGNAVPLGILLGPMMCGIYYSFFQMRRGRTIEFGNLFKGFDYFGPSVIATLIHVVPIVIIVVPAYIAFYVGFILTMFQQQQNGEPNPGLLFGFLGVFMVFWLAVIVVVIIVSIVFTFVYPLIVDRGLSGVDAVKLSFRAALANFWRLLGLFLLNFLLGLAGVILCYVGIILVFPITFAAVAVAYEQVFGLGEPISNLPPPPPTFT
jgi:uncharacterized membrane protein